MGPEIKGSKGVTFQGPRGSHKRLWLSFGGSPERCDPAFVFVLISMFSVETLTDSHVIARSHTETWRPLSCYSPRRTPYKIMAPHHRQDAAPAWPVRVCVCACVRVCACTLSHVASPLAPAFTAVVQTQVAGPRPRSVTLSHRVLLRPSLPACCVNVATQGPHHTIPGASPRRWAQGRVLPLYCT